MNNAIDLRPVQLGLLACRLILALFFLATGVIKMWTGHHPHYEIEPVWFYAFGLAECAVGSVLVIGTGRLGSYLSLALSLGIIAASLLMPRGECGCFGGLVEISAAQRLIIGSLTGFLSCVLCCSSKTSESTLQLQG